jgi:hypothetical protein
MKQDFLTGRKTAPMESKSNEQHSNEQLKIFTLRQLLERKVAKTPFLVEGMLQQQGIGFLQGPSDSNKSTLARQLAFGVINGADTFLGRKLNYRTRKVVFVSTEDDDDSTAGDVQTQMAGKLSDGADNNLLFIFHPLSGPKQLAAILGNVPVDLIVFDTWIDMFNGNPNDAVQVRQNLLGYKALAEKYGCFIWCIHHLRKGSEGQNPSKEQMLGSMAMEAFSRSVIDLRREGDHRRLSIVKGNRIDDQLKKQPIMLRYNPDTGFLEESDLPPKDFGLQNSREYGDEKEFYLPHIIELRKEGLSFDKITITLEEMFPDKETPSKGTIHKWFKELGGDSSSQSNP